MSRAPMDPDGVELTVTPHARRRGWEIIRITYCWRDPRHAKQAEAVFTALAKARREALEDQEDAVPAGGQP